MRERKARERRARATRAGADAGFTLLEVLVAFAIAALALGVLYEGAIGGVSTARTAGRVAEALSQARSRLAAIGAAGPPAAGEQSGEEGGFRWRTRVAPGAAVPLTPSLSGAPDPRAPRLVLFDEAVRVEWGDGESVRAIVLQSRRLGLAAPPPP